jgi:hypothetical protein
MRLPYVLATIAIAISDVAAQSPTSAYISTTLKGDTIAVETYARSDATVVGEIRGVTNHQRLAYTLTLGDSDLVSRVEVAVRPDTAKPTAPPTQAFTLSFRGDSMQIASATQAKSFAMKHGTLPWINPSFSLIEQIVRRTHRLDPSHAHRDSLQVFDLSSGPVPVIVSWKLPDSAVIQFPNTTARAEIDLFDHVTGVLFPDGTVMHARQLKH